MSKYFGQHFLKNKNKIKKIIEALDLKSGDKVIEIGPGHGELTFAVIKKLSNLVIKNFKIIAIEKDKKLADILKKSIETKWKFNGNSIEIIQGDVLKILPNLITQLPNYPITNYKIIGNIPYYITGYLLRVLAELERKPSLIVLTIQKEVAQRIIAESPRMNLLAASVQFWAEPEIIGYISKKDFRPVPKVDSAIIKLIPFIETITRDSIEKEKYYRFTKILFRQPRKTILNNLINAELRRNLRGTTQKKEEVIQKLHQIGINPSDRPQNLNIEQILKLSTLF
ncbi:MAG: 16S rRNA (adenine(1518)-N(6)/adenine(1519)-N(6))-dimethyltransferase RsmA [bacterium]|nr:16S rRNA (adenine(1518)-N(6)/adenine(1519)-N(6))-dimethyltransferase RsmA [bacterium]